MTINELWTEIHKGNLIPEGNYAFNSSFAHSTHISGGRNGINHEQCRDEFRKIIQGAGIKPLPHVSSISTVLYTKLEDKYLISLIRRWTGNL